jgi:hypothetical protein
LPNAVVVFVTLATVPSRHFLKASGAALGLTPRVIWVQCRNVAMPLALTEVKDLFAF